MKKFTMILLLLSLASSLFSFRLKKIKTLATGRCPKSVVVSPDGKMAYSLNLEGMSVYAFHVESRKILWRLKFYPTHAKGWDYKNRRPISSYAEKPVEGAFTGNGRYLWVSLHNAAKVVVIDTQWKTKFQGKTMKARLYAGKSKRARVVRIKSIRVGHTPKVIAVSPGDKFVYVANWHSHNVSVINPKNYRVIKTIRVVRIPRGMAFSPDGKYAYIANMGSNVITKVDVENNHKVIKHYKVGVTPRHIVISADGRFLYVSLNRAGKIIKFDTILGKTVRSRYVGRLPRTIALSKNGNFLSVVLYSTRQVVVMDTEKLSIMGRFRTGGGPIGVEIIDELGEVWVANYRSSSMDIFKILN